MSVRSIRSRTSARSSSSASRLRSSGAWTSSSSSLTRGIGGERQPQRHEIARPRGSERGAADEALEVVDGLQHLAEPAALGRAEGELLDGIEPIADALERAAADEAATRGAAGRPSTSRCDRSRAGATLRPAFAAGDDLEVLQRDRVDDEAVGGGLDS